MSCRVGALQVSIIIIIDKQSRHRVFLHPALAHEGLSLSLWETNWGYYIGAGNFTQRKTPSGLVGIS